MKQDKKTSNAANKKAAILKDVERLFKKGEPIGTAYEKVAKKYFVATGTIYRIVIEKKLASFDAVPRKGAP